MEKISIDLSNKVILVTGIAGFIGSHLSKRLLHEHPDALIVGVDNMNDYYDVRLKEKRLSLLQDTFNARQLVFRKLDIADKASLESLFEEFKFDIVVNLAAQAGVRHGFVNPDEYIRSNVVGFQNILEACRHIGEKGHCVQHLVYASSSSVYGDNTKMPFSTDDRVDSPVSLYAATKRCDELLAHACSNLYDIPSTGLRFFSVYGPYGRPDMAYFKFTEQLVAGGVIKIYNHGNCARDFTYIDDIVEGMVRVIRNAPARSPFGKSPHCIYNIGTGRPTNTKDLITTLEEELVSAGVLPPGYNFEAHKVLVPAQPGDVETTWADTSALENDFGFKPAVSLREGLRNFARWYYKYYLSNKHSANRHH